MSSIGTLTLDSPRIIDSLQVCHVVITASTTTSLLDVGFNLPRSANAYTIPSGNEMFKIVQGEEEAANMRIMDMVFAACVNLDVLVLRAVVTKGEGRQAQNIQRCTKRQKIVEMWY